MGEWACQCYARGPARVFQNVGDESVPERS